MPIDITEAEVRGIFKDVEPSIRSIEIIPIVGRNAHAFIELSRPDHVEVAVRVAVSGCSPSS